MNRTLIRATVPALLLLLLLGFAANRPMAVARIKLAALPARDRVDVQLDNGAFTLVEEERIVPLLKSSPEIGNNAIDFSWSNTNVDKDSIQFRPISIREGDKFVAIKKVKINDKTEVDEIGVINVAYPPNENALVWEVFAARACAVKVRVSYLISNFDRYFSYRALADKEETKLSLINYMQIRNYSGENFGNSGIWAGFGEAFTKVIDNQQEIKMLLRRFDNVPVEKTFTMDWYANGALSADKPFASKILMHYKLINDAKNAMGVFPLQPGKVRIFIEDGKGGEAFLGEDVSGLVPLDGEMKIYLGEARDIVCTRTIESNVRSNVRGNLYNQEIIIKYEIENFKPKAATLRIQEHMNNLAAEYFGSLHGDVEWEKGRTTSEEIRIDIEKGGVNPILSVDLAAAPTDKDKKVEKKTVRFHFTIKNLW